MKHRSKMRTVFMILKEGNGKILPLSIVFDGPFRISRTFPTYDKVLPTISSPPFCLFDSPLSK